MPKKQKGETRYGYAVRSNDPLHRIMPIVMGSRTDNEAVANFEIPAKQLDDYLARKNAERPEGMPKYTYLHAISAALARVIEARPLMNRYIKRERFFDRKEIAISFMAKKQMKDCAEESLVVVNYDRNSEKPSIDLFHDAICKQVSEIRKENKVGSTDKLIGILNHLPQWFFKFVVRFLMKFDDKDLLPESIINSLPYGSTCFISNLGSIKMNASFHHLINFGSNSFFMIIGAKYKKPDFHEDGTFTLEEVIPISVTLDERIADGIYFGNSLRLLKGVLLHPDLLDTKACEKVNLNELVTDII